MEYNLISISSFSANFLAPILYKAAVRYKIENQENLTLFQQPVDDLIIENQRVKGVITQMGLEFFADKIILTSGTF